MQTSEEGIMAIIAFEGLELNAYHCPAGVWTIGAGHTGEVDGTPVGEGMSITEEKARQLLQNDLAVAERCINRQPFASQLSQGQFDALVSFVFNVGVAAFRSSTLRKKLCAGDCSAAGEFRRWVYGTVGGKKMKLPGLVKRREREMKMFLFDVYVI